MFHVEKGGICKSIMPPQVKPKFTTVLCVSHRANSNNEPEYTSLTSAVDLYISREISFSGTCIAFMYEFDLLFVLNVFWLLFLFSLISVKLIMYY